MLVVMKEYKCVYSDTENHIHRDAGHHDDEALPGRFRTEFPGLRRQFHRFLVHAFVYHAGNLNITSQRKPPDAVFRISSFKAEEFKTPGIKKQVEFLYPYAKSPCGQEMTQF